MARDTDVGPRAERAGDRLVGRHAETKWAPLTTEFWAMVVAIVAILIAAAVVGEDDGGGDAFGARSAWLYVAIVVAAYLVSRGLAKSAVRRHERER
jgi:hypothetical protein